MRKLVSAIIIALLCLQAKAQNQPAEPETANSTLENYTRITPREIMKNPVSLFADNWFVVSAGNSTKFNEMAISWGTLGYGWNVPTATVFIRNTRYTYPFINNGKYFVLNSFDEMYRDKVKYIGTHSGRNTDKVKGSGLTPGFTPLGNPYFKEAKMIIECEKIYYDDIDRSHILFEDGRKVYDGGPSDTHRMFVGKIINVWVKQ